MPNESSVSLHLTATVFCRLMCQHFVAISRLPYDPSRGLAVQVCLANIFSWIHWLFRLSSPSYSTFRQRSISFLSLKQGPQFSEGNLAKFCLAICEISRLSAASCYWGNWIVLSLVFPLHFTLTFHLLRNVDCLWHSKCSIFLPSLKFEWLRIRKFDIFPFFDLLAKIAPTHKPLCLSVVWPWAFTFQLFKFSKSGVYWWQYFHKAWRLYDDLFDNYGADV